MSFRYSFADQQDGTSQDLELLNAETRGEVKLEPLGPGVYAVTQGKFYYEIRSLSTVNMLRRAGVDLEKDERRYIYTSSQSPDALMGLGYGMENPPLVLDESTHNGRVDASLKLHAAIPHVMYDNDPELHIVKTVAPWWLEESALRLQQRFYGQAEVDWINQQREKHHLPPLEIDTHPSGQIAQELQYDGYKGTPEPFQADPDLVYQPWSDKKHRDRHHPDEWLNVNFWTAWLLNSAFGFVGGLMPLTLFYFGFGWLHPVYLLVNLGLSALGMFVWTAYERKRHYGRTDREFLLVVRAGKVAVMWAGILMMAFPFLFMFVRTPWMMAFVFFPLLAVAMLLSDRVYHWPRIPPKEQAQPKRGYLIDPELELELHTCQVCHEVMATHRVNGVSVCSTRTCEKIADEYGDTAVYMLRQRRD